MTKNKTLQPPKCHVNLFLEGKLILTTRTHIKDTFKRLIESVKWDRACFRVSYGNGFFNSGEYDIAPDLMWAFEAFTENFYEKGGDKF